MPKCNKCNKIFPTKIVIGGVLRNLRSRKRCLDCWPNYANNIPIIGHCAQCNKKYYYTLIKLEENHICNDCKTDNKRRAMKRRALAYMGGACWFCGYSKAVRSLHFHHINENDKEFVIARGKMDWKIVKTELDKCVLVCANCHGELHEGIIKFEDAKIVGRKCE